MLVTFASLLLLICLLLARYLKSRRLFRRHFPLVMGSRLVYLDNAATSQKPQEVINTMVEFYSKSNAGVHRGSHQLGLAATGEYEAARSTIAEFIGAPGRSVIITRGATHALNEVANGLTLHPGDICLVSEAAHHSNYLPWLTAAARAGATVVQVPWNATSIDWEIAVTCKVAVVAVHHVSHVFGTLSPVDVIRSRMHAVCPHALLVIDACQSLPHIPVDVVELGCDVLVGSGHKMFGPTGVGFMFLSDKALRSIRPFTIGGGSIINANGDMAEFPHCFEPGTPPVAEAVGLAAACRFIRKTHATSLLHVLEEEASKLNACTVLCDGNRRVIPLISLAFKDEMHAEDVAALCDVDGVCVRAGNHCAALLHERLGLRRGSLRLSCQGYNTADEVVAAMRSVKRAVERLSKSNVYERVLLT